MDADVVRAVHDLTTRWARELPAGNDRSGGAGQESNTVVSGLGLQNIYNFLRDTKRAEEPAWLVEEIKNSNDVGAVISQNALDGKSEICLKTLDMFVSLYGAEAGNMALRLLATGGVYIGGGIAPKILPKLKEKAFIESFFSKGRMRELLELMPVRVILNDKAALLGAAHFAFYEIAGNN